MDPARSESAAQTAAVTSMTLVIKQSASDLSIETRKGGSDKSTPTVETLKYRLDGSELSMPGDSEVPVKTRARWDGSKLITDTAGNINGAAVTLTHVLSVDTAGKVLTIEKTLAVQHGYQGQSGKNSSSGTDIFVKAKSSADKAPARR